MRENSGNTNNLKSNKILWNFFESHQMQIIWFQKAQIIHLIEKILLQYWHQFDIDVKIDFKQLWKIKWKIMKNSFSRIIKCFT